MSEVTRILDRVQQGDPQAAEELLALVYEELRKLAAHKMANEASSHTLQPTALVHEVWLTWAGSGHESAVISFRRSLRPCRASAPKRLDAGGAATKRRFAASGPGIAFLLSATAVAPMTH